MVIDGGVEGELLAGVGAVVVELCSPDREGAEDLSVRGVVPPSVFQVREVSGVAAVKRNDLPLHLNAPGGVPAVGLKPPRAPTRHRLTGWLGRGLRFGHPSVFDGVGEAVTDELSGARRDPLPGSFGECVELRGVGLGQRDLDDAASHRARSWSGSARPLRSGWSVRRRRVIVGYGVSFASHRSARVCG